MGFRLKPYQEAAVYDETDGLLATTLRFLKSDKQKRLFVLKSIMGSGKTIIASEYIEALLNAADRARTERELCIVWLSTGNAGLHMQSAEKLRAGIKDKDIHIYGIQTSYDFQASRFYDKDVYVLNWEKMNNQKNGKLSNNLFIDSELNNLRSAMRNSPNVDFVLIIDEFHRNYDTDSYNKIIDFFNPHVIVGMSATPSDYQMANADAKYVIPVADVIEAGMIKKGICFNIASDYTGKEITGYKTYADFFMLMALRQRELLERKYRVIGSNVIPLLMIQCNDDKSNEEIIRVKEFLDQVYDNNRNNDYAIWISETDNRKDKLRSPDEIIKNLDNNQIRVLVFKQAVATGWDCPRAQVLLRYRHITNQKDAQDVSAFDVQTLGRIIRMPEPECFVSKRNKHYDDEDLNYGYVFVPNNSYRLEKDFKQTFGDAAETYHKNTFSAHFPTDNQMVEGEQITLPGLNLDNMDMTEHSDIIWNDEDEKSDTATIPKVKATPEKTEEEKYSETYGAAMKEAEECLSKVNVVAVDKCPDDVAITQAIKEILEKGFSVQKNIRDNDEHIESITFYGSKLTVSDDLLKTGKSPKFEEDISSFSIDDTPSVLADKAEQLLSRLIDRKQYSKTVKKYLKTQIKKLFREKFAGCTTIDEESSAKTSKQILLHEEIVREIIRDTDDAIREMSSYFFEKSPFYFPKPMYPLQNRRADSKGLYNYPLSYTASRPEQYFERILNNPNNNVLLWHKNSDHGSNAFCIPYSMKHQSRGKTIEEEVPTYPDFIVLFKDGNIGIYETKDYDKQDEKDMPKESAIHKTILNMNHENPAIKVFGGIVYMDQQTQTIRNKEDYPELF